jgi:hypothetical protein
MESRVLLDFKGIQMVLDLHSEGCSRAASAVALSMTRWYSPRVRAVSASPELELAGMDGLAGDSYDFELRLGNF